MDNKTNKRVTEAVERFLGGHVVEKRELCQQGELPLRTWRAAFDEETGQTFLLCDMCGQDEPLCVKTSCKPPKKEVEEQMNEMQEEWNEYNRLWKVVQEKGFKPGWAAHKYKEKFGEWPPDGWREKLEGRIKCLSCNGTGWAQKEGDESS